MKENMLKENKQTSKDSKLSFRLTCQHNSKRRKTLNIGVAQIQISLLKRILD